MRYALGLSVALACGQVWRPQACRGQDWSVPGAYAAGRRIVTVPRPDQTTFTAQVFYPATQAGDNTPIAPGPGTFPIVAFGHGAATVLQYRSTLEHLATWGMVVIAAESQAGPSPDHAAFAADLKLTATWTIAQGQTPGSFVHQRIDFASLAYAGHAMGGGAAILAAADDPRARTVATLAPAETNPSATAASGSLTVPSFSLCGDRDTVVPQERISQPIFGAVPGPRQLVSIVGGFHCGFLESSGAGCDSPGWPMVRATQLELTRQHLTRWFLLQFGRAPASLWSEVWGPAGMVDTRLNRQVDPDTYVTAPATITITGGQATALDLTILNTAAPTAFEITASAPGVAPSATRTVVIDRDTPTLIAVQFSAAPGGSSSPVEGVISARRLDDGTTRGWTPVIFEVHQCAADFNRDDFLDFFDYDDFVRCFETANCPPGQTADFNGDDFADFFDYDDFVRGFEIGC